MKLILCGECQDVRKILSTNTSCFCGKSGGRYLDNLFAEYWGSAIPLGFDNYSLVDACKAPDRSDGKGVKFDAFVVPRVCATYKKVIKSE
jgi:hypothetical protein